MSGIKPINLAISCALNRVTSLGFLALEHRPGALSFGYFSFGATEK
jgi:hypothetical protein